MPILDSIKTAEAKAEELRENARLEVSALLEKTVKEVGEKVDKLYLKLKEDEVELATLAETNLKNLEKEIESTYKKENDLLLKAANNNKDAVHKLILEKVFDL